MKRDEKEQTASGARNIRTHTKRFITSVSHAENKQFKAGGKGVSCRKLGINQVKENKIVGGKRRKVKRKYTK